MGGLAADKATGNAYAATLQTGRETAPRGRREAGASGASARRTANGELQSVSYPFIVNIE